jgi:hypothetical protein
VTEERDFVVTEMKKQNLKPQELAALSNLGIVTVLNFITGRTFSPHHRTVVSLFHGLGYELALPSGKKIVRYKASTKTRRKKTGND